MMKHGKMTLKRYLAAVMALVMLAGVCPLSAFADDTRTDIVVENITLGMSTVALTDQNDSDNPVMLTVTADVTVPDGFDGTKPFYFWFQEQVPEEQCRGYDPVYATQDSTTGNWTISGEIAVSTWWPQGEYKLSHVTYENHEQRVSFTGDVSVTVDRSQVSDNADPVATGITVTSDGAALANGGEVQWDGGAVLKIRVAVEDGNHLTGQGNMVLRSDNNARYEAPTEYVNSSLTDSDGNVTYTREMVLTVNVADLEPGKWHIEHFTIDDVYGNYVFYNYNGDETDSDGNDNGNDDLLDDVTFTVASDATRVFFVNEDGRWDAANGFYVELKKENGDILTGKSMKWLEGGINGWVWYAWIDSASWSGKYSVTVYNGNDNTASDSITTNEMTGTADMLVRSMDADGNIIAGLDTFDPDKWMGGEDGGESGHEVFIHIKDGWGNLLPDTCCHTSNSGTIDLSDEGITLDFAVEDFVFPDDAGELKGTELEFVGWYVRETGQLITADSSDEIATDEYQINLYPQYTAAPFRVQAHYVNGDGDQQTDTKWVSVPYGTSVSTASAGFDLNSVTHTGDHTFVAWHSPYTGTEPLTPDMEGVVYVAEYDQLYFTLNYEYLVDVEVNGLTREDWMHEVKTVFVPDAAYTSQKVADYFLAQIAPTIVHADRFSTVTWDYDSWTPGSEEISFGNCYGIKANYAETRLYFLNTDQLWNTDDGLFMQVLDDQGAVVWSGGLDPVVGSIDNYCWYAWVNNTALENKESLKFKVYAGADANAASWTKPIELPGDTDMVVLDVNDAPASGEFEAGNEHFDLGGWYMDNGGNEGGEGEGGGEVSGHAVNFYVSADGAMEHIFRLETDVEDVSFSTEFSKLSAEDQARLTVSQYTFPEWADNGLANTTLAFEGWLVLETGELITETNDLIQGVEEYEINLVAQFTQVPVCMAAGYVDSNGVYQVYSQWYSIAHGTRLGDVLDGFEAKLSQLSHSEEYQFLEWNMLDDWDRDSDVHAAISSVEYVAVHEKKYVTINYSYLTDITDGDGATGTKENGGSKTVFVEDDFTDLDVADYFLEVIAPTLTDHAGGKAPAWKYDHWTPSPTVSSNANCYGIYAEYPVEMDTDKVTSVKNAIANATEGTTVPVNMNTDSNDNALEETVTVIPSDILKAAADKKVDVVFDMGGYNWTVDSETIDAANVGSINLKVELDGQSLHDIDPGKTEDYGYKQQISIAHDGEFGFTASLEIPVVEGLEEQFQYAILLYYVPALGKLMPIASRPVVEGKVSFEFSHASDYLVVYSESEVYPVAGADLNGDGDFTEEEVFSTLAEAVAAANAAEDQTEPVWVLLARDTVETETITVTGNIRLELDTYDVTALPGSNADTILFHITTGSLTIAQTTTPEEESGENEGVEGAYISANGELFRVGVKDGTNDENVQLNVHGGWYESQNDCCIVIYDGSTTLGTGESLNVPRFVSYSTDYAAIQGSGTQYGDLTVNMATIRSEYQEGIYWPQNGTLTVYNGSISGTTAIYAKQGAVNIEGGSFYGYQDEKTEYVPNGNGCNGTGDAIVLDNCGYGTLSANISGGYFYSDAGAPIGSYASGENENGEANTALAETDYMADDVYVSPTGDVVAYQDVSSEQALNEAIAGALNEDGELNYVIRLADDFTVSAEVVIGSDLVIDGQGHTISGALKRIFKIINDTEGHIYVDMYDLTVINTKNEGRCVDTRDASISVSMQSCTLTAEGTNSQPITVGGPENTSVSEYPTDTTVDIYLYGTTINAGNSGYGIIAFVPAWIYVDEASVINGWNSIYMKGETHPTTGEDTGNVGTTGSYVWIDGTLNSTNIHSGDSNNFGAIVLEDSGVEIELGSCAVLNVTATGDAGQTILRPNEELATDTTVTVSTENSTLSQQLREEGYYVSEEGSCLLHYASLDLYAISLTGNIAMEFFMTLTDAVREDENAYMQFTMADGSVTKVPASEGKKTDLDGQTYWKFTCYKAAKEMTEEVKVQFFYNGTSTEEKTYSVAGYAGYILGGNYDEKTKAVVTAMLHYGAYAQTHFGHNTDVPANEGLEAVDLTTVKADTLSGFKKDAQSDGKVTLKSVSLVLETETTLSLYFELAEGVTGFTVKHNGQELTPKAYGTLWYVDIEDIPAKELDTKVVLEVSYDGLAEPFEVSYYPLTYCYNVLNNPDSMKTLLGEEKYATLADLVRAMYLYNQAANAYFDTVGEE